MDEERVRARLLIDGLCEEDERVHIDCQYTCKTLKNLDGLCRDTKSSYKSCECGTHDDWQKLIVEDFFENSKYKSK